ncbi:MAG: hypothetical protein M0P01_14595 [Treponema sp.]|nr:hypothetical protein [Treponema sp.]
MGRLIRQKLDRMFEKNGMVESRGSGLFFYRPSYTDDKTTQQTTQQTAQETISKLNNSQKLIVAYIRKTAATAHTEMTRNIAGITKDGIK